MNEIIIIGIFLVGIGILAGVVTLHNKIEDITIERELNHKHNMEMFPR